MIAYRKAFNRTFGEQIEDLRLWGPKGAHHALNNASRQLAANFRTEQSTTTYKLIMGYAIRLLELQFEPVQLAKPVKLPSRFDTLNGFDSEQLDVCFTFAPHGCAQIIVLT